MLLTRFGLRFSLELYDDDGELLREIEAGTPSAPVVDRINAKWGGRLAGPAGAYRRTG